MRRATSRSLTVPAVATALLLAGCAGSPSRPAADAVCAPLPAAQLLPSEGAWTGAQLDFDGDPLATYASTLGERPAVVGVTAEVPMRPADRERVNTAVEELVDARGILLLTLEPYRGLSTVTDAVAAELAIRLDDYNSRGVPVVVRFAPEMNGHWYEWGQQPTAYVAAFRRIADALHTEAPGSATLWAPAYGGGYPFTADLADESDAAVLDVDRDGVVTRADDPYAPYWPGAEAVDWVGLSLFHWGSTWPWGENEVPEPGKLLAQMTGTYDGLGGDDRALPDFYATYGDGHDKPVAIPETGALWAPGSEGASELAVKRAWFHQAFDADLLERLPRLAMVTWVERELPPDDDLPAVDWRALARPEVAEAYRAELPAWARWAESVPRCGT